MSHGARHTPNGTFAALAPRELDRVTGALSSSAKGEMDARFDAMVRANGGIVPPTIQTVFPYKV